EGPARVSRLLFSPDGGFLVAGGLDDAVTVWELGSGEQRACFRGHCGPVEALAFRGDGKVLLTGSADTSILFWDTAGVVKNPPAQGERTAPELERLWQDLKSSEGGRVFAAMRGLATSPGRAVALMRKHLRPTTLAEPTETARLLRTLAEGGFAARERA